MRKQTVYYRQEVDALAAKRTFVSQDAEEMTIPKLAKHLGTSRQHIDYFIKANNLPVNRVEVRGRARISLPAATVEVITNLYQESLNNSAKYKRHLYYNEKTISCYSSYSIRKMAAHFESVFKRKIGVL